MKKRLLLPACLVGMTLLAQAQSNVPPPPPPPEPPKVTMVKTPPPPRIVRNEPMKDFLHNNPDVIGIKVTNKLVIVTRKDNSIEKYNLADDAQAKAFKEKYGELPAPPPPPLPPKEKSLSLS
ncbi:MAG TPA: hypothetical protein VK644_10885 [Chitinophagaceae bacterium]|nr:hypothetical protein [Chitinophagaceae bacterium]